MLVVAVMLNALVIFAQVDAPPPPPAPPGGPVLKIEGDKVTIVTTDGNTYIIDDYGIRKNGILIVGDSETMRDDIEDVQDEINNLRDEADAITPGSEEYNDLIDELNDLENELADIGVTDMRMDTLPGDSTSVTVGKWRLIVKEEGNDGDDVDVSFERIPEVEEIDDRYVDMFDTQWFLFDMGYNTFLNADNKVQVDAPYQDLEDLHGWGSFDVNLHIFRSRVNMAKGFINFNYGLSMEWHHFRFDRNFSIIRDMDSLTLNTEEIEYDKNKFNTTHISVPLLLGFETKPWDTENSFRMQFGYDPGLMLRGKTKHKYNSQKDVEKDDFNLAPFRHEVDFIIGYGDFNIYASYDVNSMFAEGEGPELHPFSIGLVLRKGF